MSTVKAKYLKDENGEKFSPVVSADTVYLGGGTKLLDCIYPVGSIYISTASTNPQTYFGGTWEEFAKGRTLIGIDPDDTDFNKVENTGGEKTHTLTTSEMPKHLHSVTLPLAAGPSGTGWSWLSDRGPGKYHESGSAGGDQPHNNLQPYITVYMWKRTK